ncbi:hypothetical protein [Mycobacterium sp. 1274756.6]|uniref:hypothetical protein n=1 Tax=Mycobacterium sp. 1274756.6 TaxID=1834076 RepID=UPI001E4C8513|nr:hypothetical protein [Mycobacterium sp. 1274756.6]
MSDQTPSPNGQPRRRGPVLRNDPTVRVAARFALLITVVGVAVLIAAAWWASGCDAGAMPDAACGVPQRAALALAAPVVLFAGATRAFVRTYRRYRAGEQWWGWQGAGWFLLMLCFAILLMSGVPIAGPGLFD